MRIACIKYGGLAASGTERWLQELAAELAKHGAAVDFFWCDARPDPVYGQTHPLSDDSRRRFLSESGVHLVEFQVPFRDLGSPRLTWKQSDFWKHFDETRYDVIHTAKSGATEYPFSQLRRTPFIQTSTLIDMPDTSRCHAWTFHLSNWALKQSLLRGGRRNLMSVAPIPTYPPQSEADLRAALGIPDDALVFGLHQRASDAIFSPVPLEAFAKTQSGTHHFIMLGGSDAHRKQVASNGIENVHFLSHDGSSETISRFLNSLDVYLHGRRDGETFGAVIAEALMHEVPVITHMSPSGANAHRETLGPGGVFAYSPDEYLTAAKALAESAELRVGYGRRGRKHVEKFFSHEAFRNAVAHGYSGAGLGELASHLVPSVDQATGGFRYFAEMPAGYLQVGSTGAHGHIIGFADAGIQPEDFDTYLFSFFLRNMQTLLDVGASAGLYTPFALQAHSTLHVHAFEPLTSARRDLEDTIAVNGWEDRCDVWPMALADREGRESLHVLGSGSTLRPEFNDFVSEGVEEVTVTTLDAWVRLHLPKTIDFIKVDVEGSELQFLEGGRCTIQQWRPILFLESSYRIRGREYVNSSYQQVLDWLAQFGYRCFISDGERNLAEVPLNHRPDHIYMLLAVPEERCESIVPSLLAWVRQFPRRGHLYYSRRRTEAKARQLMLRMRWKVGHVVQLLRYRNHLRRLRSSNEVGR